jgi:hypothetical protein
VGVLPPTCRQGEEDLMITSYATSVDRLRWRDRGVVLGGMPGTWDERGARITAILNEAPLPRIGLSGLAWLGNRMGR